MIRRITGAAVERGPGMLIVHTGGLGYRVHVPATLAARVADGDTVTLHTHLHIRETAHELYGFALQDDLFFFERLIDVNGVGPKSALHLMALGSVEEIKAAIARGDTGFLTSISGVGKKTAERIVVEMREAMQKHAGTVTQGTTGVWTEVAEALISLGYKNTEVQNSMAQLRRDGISGSAEHILREALRLMQKI